MPGIVPEPVRTGPVGEATFDEIVERYAPEMLRLACTLVGNPADAEDILQETFAGALRGWEGFERRSSVRTWLTRILLNQAARHRRYRRLRRALSLDRSTDDREDARGAMEPASPAASTEMSMDVRAALDALSPDHREVIVLREYQGMSYDEIAETLKLPRGTVESRLFRARQELKESLKAYLP